MIDALTLFISTFLTYFALSLVVLQVWLQNRNQFQGIGFWLLSLAAPTLTLALVSLRDTIPDFLSVVLALSLLPLGCYFLIVGLERFFGCKGSPWVHFGLIGILFLIAFYFTYFQPDIRVRVAAFNAITGIQYLMGAYLLRKKIPLNLKPIGNWSAIILMLMAVCNGCRVFIALEMEPNVQRFTTHPWDPIPLLFIQVLTVLLVISMLMMINRRHSALLWDSQQEIVRREKRYKAVVDSSPSGIAIIDQTQKIVFANAQFSRMLKLDPEDVIGKNFVDYVAPEFRDRSIHVFIDRQGGVVDVPAIHEVAVLGSGGRIKYLEIHGSIFEKTAEYCHTLIHATDITARKKSEIALMDYQRNLEDMVRGRGHQPSVIHEPGAGA